MIAVIEEEGMLITDVFHFILLKGQLCLLLVDNIYNAVPSSQEWHIGARMPIIQKYTQANHSPNNQTRLSNEMGERVSNDNNRAVIRCLSLLCMACIES